MPTIKVRALVIKEKDMSESSKQLTLFAKDLGRIIVSARGAKNIKSRFHSCAQTFCYGDFVLYQGNKFLSVTEASLITNFSVFYNDIFKFAFGSYFLELVDKTIMNDQEANDILLLLLKSLQLLKTAAQPKKISVAFQVKFLDLLGFRLTPQVCAVCGSYSEKIYFSLYDGFVCSCRKTKNFLVSDDIKKAVSYISDDNNVIEGYHKIFMFTASESLLNDLHTIAEKIIKNQLEINTNSLELM